MTDKAPHLSTLTVSTNSPREAARHSKIEQVNDDVFMVRGRMKSTSARPLFERIFVYYSRTMTIVRRQGTDGSYELTLINTIRLNEKTLTKLTELGTIKNVVRLGAFHGVDDAFYLQRFNAKYWTVEGMVNAPGLTTMPSILSCDNLPISDANFFSFQGLAYPEAIILLNKTERRSGVAITTDAIQNHTSVIDIDNSPLVSLAIWRIGLSGRARLGPIWLREQALSSTEREELSAPEKRKKIVEFFKPQFQRLLDEHDFKMLLPGHGWPIYNHADEAIKLSIDKQLALD